MTILSQLLADLREKNLRRELGEEIVVIEGRHFALKKADAGYWYFLADVTDPLFGNARVRKNARHKYKSVALRALKGYIRRGG